MTTGKRYRIRGPETWAMVRERYLAGDSAPTLAEIYDVTVYAIRKRAYVEGWTHKAHALATDLPPAKRRRAPVWDGSAETGLVQEDGDAVSPPTGPVSAEQAFAYATLTAVRALGAGKVAEATAAAKAAEIFGRLAGVGAGERERVFTPDGPDVLALLQRQFGAEGGEAAS